MVTQRERGILYAHATITYSIISMISMIQGASHSLEPSPRWMSIDRSHSVDQDDLTNRLCARAELVCF